MSLFKIDKRLKELGLSPKQRKEIIQMVREFGIAAIGRSSYFPPTRTYLK
jgi:hypothetical protein